MTDLWDKLSEVYNMPGLPDEAMSIIGDVMLAWSESQGVQPELNTALYTDGFNDGYAQGKKDSQPSFSRDHAYDRSAEPCGERLISLRAAIDEIKEIYEWHDNVTKERIIEHLERLPSAQPEQRWIPVSERLPEKNCDYLVTGRQGAVNKRKYEDGRWYGNWAVLAWMPLPEGYRGEQE